MARYVIAASPLTKIYLKDWEDRLLAEPDLMFDDKLVFTFDVPRGTCAFKATFNKPIQLMGRDDKEIDTLFNWLTGEAGQSHLETDIYGIVPFDPGVDLVERQDQIAQLEELISDDPATVAKAQKEIAKIQKDTAARLKNMRAEVRKMADEKVMRAAKIVHNNLIRQWQINQESNQGKYPPSCTELFGGHLLKKEIEKAAARGADLRNNMSKMLEGIGV